MRPLTFIAFIAFVGFVLLIAATYCPMLRLAPLHSWDVYDLNKPYGITMLLVFVIGILGTVLNQPKITRMAAYISLGLVIVFYIAAVLKVNHAFSFIPFKSIAGYLSRQIKFKWGWYILFIGQLLALAGVINNQPKKIQ
jgi:hypothetical protein